MVTMLLASLRQVHCCHSTLIFDTPLTSLLGSGKTASYLIPIISGLMGKAKKLRGPRGSERKPARAEPLVLIIVPTRELAVQVFDEARRMCYRSMLRPCVAYGGFPLGLNMKDMGKGCDILIGTCGRLMDLLGKPEVLGMHRVKHTIIDEADEMLGDDWAEDLKLIMAGGSKFDLHHCSPQFH